MSVGGPSTPSGSSPTASQGGSITLAHHVAIGAIKAFNYAYDVLTLPLYTIAQQPWRKWYNRYVYLS